MYYRKTGYASMSIHTFMFPTGTDFGAMSLPYS